MLFPELEPVLINEPKVSTPLAPSLNGLPGAPELYSSPCTASGLAVNPNEPAEFVASLLI